MHMRAKFFTAHYGEGFTSCPLAGCNSHELCAGGMDDVLDDLWSHREGKLVSTQPLGNVAPLSASDWVTLLGDFHKYRNVDTAILKLKNAYAQNPPHSLATLALADEQEARRHAFRITDSVDKLG